jgi:hypothetical protein
MTEQLFLLEETDTLRIFLIDIQLVNLWVPYHRDDIVIADKAVAASIT